MIAQSFKIGLVSIYLVCVLCRNDSWYIAVQLLKYFLEFCQSVGPISQSIFIVLDGTFIICSNL